MPVSVKVMFTVLTGLFILVLTMVIDRGDRGGGDARMWRRGEQDGFRKSIMMPDGRFRRYMKPLVISSLIAFLGAMWLLL